MSARLYSEYKEKIVPAMQEQFAYANRMQVPKLEKIVINMGVGDASQDSKLITQAAEELTLIAGQKAVITRAKKSEAGFKIRENMAIGCKVTLRGARMYEFLDRFVTIALPRVRDFRGLNAKSCDGRGNYNMGLKEQIIFAEINYDKVDKIRGMDITFVTTANNNEQCIALLEKFNMPFRKAA